MSNKLAPVSRRELIKRLRKLGFEGPYPGTDHEYMVNGDRFVPIPNPHRREIGVNLLAEILKEAEISREDWFSV
ncbi:MAG TPA: type II toxin-antitoxin system HicA family toxin [Methanothrix sp.]|nr:type II toxin-antitoxin system HicA family toxin [Methanothrix sp.]